MLPSCARTTPAKYRKWSIARGMSAASVSRTGLPFSQVSATAIFSRCSSSRFAILLRMLARSVAEVRPHRSAAACAASRASSTSAAEERATSQKTLPFTGDGLSKYRPSTGATHSPPMKLSYRGAKATMLPSVPGCAYTMAALLGDVDGEFDGATVAPSRANHHGPRRLA